MKLLYFIFNDVEYEIRVGQNKHENWELLDDADKNDLWFHVANASSAYVILSVISEHTVPKPVIAYCAELCQAHSKMKHETKCRIMYTQIRNVAKGKHVGEALVSSFSTI
jgi:predicted ribosome quality control (RQC) complex YloA/Tae2 family protein